MRNSFGDAKKKPPERNSAQAQYEQLLTKELFPTTPVH